jgi:uncharacterized protein (TIGR00725 family)
MPSPSDPQIAVFGSSTIDRSSPEWDEAYRCGRLLAQRGFVIATGGYGGTMEAASQGAHDTGGHVIGVTAPSVFPDRIGANPFVTEEQPAATLTERIHLLLDRSAGVIALPGNLGTFTELVMAWNIAYVAAFGRVSHPPIAAVGDRWRELVSVVARRLASGDLPIACVDSVNDAVAHVVRA